jgi:DNA-dependent RNA polymerase auxiliary subunit epsilon
VHLYIRNRSRNKVFNIALNDTVPSLLSYKENTSIGYLSPSQVKQRKKGKTRLNWDIQSLDPLEERILVYEAEPRLEVLGQVDLPSAQASFEDSEGNTRTYESNAPNAGEDTTYLAGREK